MIAAAALAVAAAAAQTTPVGINAAVRNRVEIRSGATGKIQPAVLRQQVILNDEVRTADASWLQILLLDKSTFTVGANARVSIDRFVYDPRANSRSTGISITRGAFRFMSGRGLGKPAGPAIVRTPVATVGIRGTIFEGVVGAAAVAIAEREPAVGKVRSDRDAASLIVLRGPGPQTQGDADRGLIDVSAARRTVTLDSPGLAVYVPRAGVPPIGPFWISPAGLLDLQMMLRPAPAGLAPLPEFAQRILALHNAERAMIGSMPLQWDPQLADSASAYARQLAGGAPYVHAARAGRENERENLARAPRGASPERLLQDWRDEKRNFMAGTFPNVSRTGNWQDISHYTQMIWPTTTHVGCGTAREIRWDFLVCRYFPPGNRDGSPVP